MPCTNCWHYFSSISTNSMYKNMQRKSIPFSFFIGLTKLLNLLIIMIICHLANQFTYIIGNSYCIWDSLPICYWPLYGKWFWQASKGSQWLGR